MNERQRREQCSKLWLTGAGMSFWFVSSSKKGTFDCLKRYSHILIMEEGEEMFPNLRVLLHVQMNSQRRMEDLF